ncbi:MAG: MBOAT family O-acyltransferase [Johnsonella sp.]|nr:MBOAT family O-acyltransferase [Johnsonella sp.]
MVFSSLEFLFIFLPVFMLVYFFAPRASKNFVLLIGSIFFYAYSALDRPSYLIVFVLSIAFNFSIGVFIDKSEGLRRFWLVIGLLCNFSVLFVFKYTNFFLSGLAGRFFPHLLLEDGRIVDLVLPIGISFYTFQAVSYLIDVYRRDIEAQYSLVNFAMYISMFPQLIAGPIVTYSQVDSYIEERKCSFSGIASGTKIFIFGLGLKVLLANQLGSLWRALEDIGFDSISTRLAWMGIAARSFQIYFDFFGYSVMAIGLGVMMGFKLPQNFDHPYTSLTMTEFWRRWHITLGSWFREYLYIPLGGNRKGELITYRNLLFVWLFTGLWHGASLNFVIWGFLLFVLIAAEKLFLGKILNGIPILGRIYMLIFIPISWVFFSIEDFGSIAVFFHKLFPLFQGNAQQAFVGDYLKYGEQYGLFLVLGLFFSTRLPYKLYSMIKDNIIGYAFLLAVFWLSVYAMYRGLDDPFLYFRF